MTSAVETALANAVQDAQSLADVVNSTAPSVTTRTGRVLKTLAQQQADALALQALVAALAGNLHIDSTASGTSGTVTPTVAGAWNQYNVNALAQAGAVAVPSGTVFDGQMLTLRVMDNGTSRSLSWNAAYRPIYVALPTQTVANRVLYMGMRYNGFRSTWDVMAVSQE